MPLMFSDWSDGASGPHGTIETGMNGRLDLSPKFAPLDSSPLIGSPTLPAPLHEHVSPVQHSSLPFRKTSDVSSLNSVGTQLRINTTDGNLRVPRSVHRRSSPVRSSYPSQLSITSALSESPSRITSPRLVHRHTLDVSRTAPRLSRDQPNYGSFVSDDLGSPNGRPSSGVSKLRRASLTLGGRATRSIHSDYPLDEPQQDEDASRWAEAYRQKRASRKRKKEEEDDDRVIVGTKVDKDHVNYETAYNMLTGIRHTVSRTNAKVDRVLTDADFTAKSKYSFDM